MRVVDEGGGAAATRDRRVAGARGRNGATVLRGGANSRSPFVLKYAIVCCSASACEDISSAVDASSSDAEALRCVT